VSLTFYAVLQKTTGFTSYHSSVVKVLLPRCRILLRPPEPVKIQAQFCRHLRWSSLTNSCCFARSPLYIGLIVRLPCGSASRSLFGFQPLLRFPFCNWTSILLIPYCFVKGFLAPLSKLVRAIFGVVHSAAPDRYSLFSDLPCSEIFPAQRSGQDSTATHADVKGVFGL